MNRIVVIADDITGAAEIAGIAHRYGLKTILTTSAPSTQDGADVIVIATDARSYDAAEAARQTAVASTCLTVSPSACSAPTTLFHKVDSALRGNVQAQLAALGGDWLYMPANPSKGRIIRDGVYYIATASAPVTAASPAVSAPVAAVTAASPGASAPVPAVSTAGPSTGPSAAYTPLHATDFRFDPEFPAWSSRLDERFPGITYANAETKADVDAVVERALAEGIHLAGAADLFCSLIEHLFRLPPAVPQPYGGLPAAASLLVVRGSTQSKAYDLGLRVESMPLDVFYEQSQPVTWAASIIDRYRRSFAPDADSAAADSRSGAILTIGDKEVRQGKSAAVYLRNAMAEVCCTLLSARQPDVLIIEGGATAYAIISRLPYTTFSVTAEIAPGVVQLTTVADGKPMTIILKPGSYSWGGLFVS